MKHAIIIEESLERPEILNSYKILRTKFSSQANWRLHIVEVPDSEKTIAEIQEVMIQSKPFYFHIYDEGETLVVVFKKRFFKLDPNNEKTWHDAKFYGGKILGIPAEELDFFPHKISLEDSWFNR